MTPRLTIILLLVLTACKKEHGPALKVSTRPEVSNNGAHIVFPDSTTASWFATRPAEISNLHADFSAPARIVATVVPSGENANQNLVLFDNPELTSNYTQFVTHLSNIRQIENVTIRQRKIELERALDLQKHGAATGREVLEAQTALALEQTNLLNEKVAMTEHEAKLKLGGFDAEDLMKANTNTVWVISDIPENQVSKINSGEPAIISLTSFPEEVFRGKVDDIGDVVDNITRMVKLRIGITNRDRRLKAGMFGTAHFGITEGKFLAVPRESLITVQGHNYVFVKTSPFEFFRKEVTVGQQVDNGIIVFDGIAVNDRVVVTGAMQMKGISFGY